MNMPSFELDSSKSHSNSLKHGIDFEEAQALWNDPMLLEIPAKNSRRTSIFADRNHRSSTLVSSSNLQRLEHSINFSQTFTKRGGCAI